MNCCSYHAYWGGLVNVFKEIFIQMAYMESVKYLLVTLCLTFSFNKFSFMSYKGLKVILVTL